MATIRVRGNVSDINIKSILYENTKGIKEVILPSGEFKKNEITENNYYTFLEIPGSEIEVKIIGTQTDSSDNVFYKNFKINNIVFNSDENPTTSFSFECDINDKYKIEIITQEKTPGNMINPGKIIEKIYIFDYQFNSDKNTEIDESNIKILTSEFDSNITINTNSDDGEDLEHDEEEEEDEEDEENDD
jgi:hypothetical protein